MLSFLHGFLLKMSMYSEMGLRCSQVLVEIPYILLADPQFLHMQLISSDSFNQFVHSLNTKMHIQIC